MRIKTNFKKRSGSLTNWSKFSAISLKVFAFVINFLDLLFPAISSYCPLKQIIKNGLKAKLNTLELPQTKEFSCVVSLRTRSSERVIEKNEFEYYFNFFTQLQLFCSLQHFYVLKCNVKNTIQ